ncbi:MAG: MMPL family transporter [Thermodesulfobacteriota bacterium]
MRSPSLVAFSVDHPRLVVLVSVALSLLAMTQLGRITTDTNPKNMLPETSAVRVGNRQVEQTFRLYEDSIVVGVQSERGVLNQDTLGRILRITDAILQVDGVAARDVSAFSTITNVTAQDGTLHVGPLMPRVPETEAELAALRRQLFDNPLFVDRIISRDGKTAAIHVPLEAGANGKEVADALRRIISREEGGEQFFVAGDPVARDTFGAEMFKLMAVFAPIAGGVMLLIRYLMFRDLFLSFALMMDAMISIVWSMGLLIALGFPIHIMSSMSPVFLMAIATDSIHIFNEFYFRYRETRDKRAAIIATMAAVSRPVRYTALATAAGFAVLVFMSIVPVKVFGVMLAFGTFALRVLSFSFIPAMFTFVPEAHLAKVAGREDADTGWATRLLTGLASLGAGNPRVTAGLALVLLAAAGLGILRLTVNNNMVEWFAEDSTIRTADRVMNEALGGTSLGYLVLATGQDDAMKDPRAMRFMEGLQRHLEGLAVVGKTTSVVDYVKRINRVLHDDDPAFDTVPESAEAIGQYLFLFGMSAKPADLDNVVDYAYRQANITVQLTTWDARAMAEVMAAAADFRQRHSAELPVPVEIRPAGIAYFNLVWNEEVLWDMLKGFSLALVVVLAILVLNFRSLRWALVGYAPLLFTILIIYGAIGFAGKDFDMPVSVLSCLSLGMAVDFAIHFISRLRQRLAESGGLPAGWHRAPAPAPQLLAALVWTAARPGKGILRNAVLFSASFAVMMVAPLTPYITVGVFIVSMMLLSALLTVLLLPALVVLCRGWLFAHEKGLVRP